MVGKALADGKVEPISAIAPPFVTMVVADLLCMPVQDRRHFMNAIAAAPLRVSSPAAAPILATTSSPHSRDPADRSSPETEDDCKMPEDRPYQDRLRRMRRISGVTPLCPFLASQSRDVPHLAHARPPMGQRIPI
jgi:hypothetical protein